VTGTGCWLRSFLGWVRAADGLKGGAAVPCADRSACTRRTRPVAAARRLLTA